jgi:DNA repair exonuclease SbcCD ATPase subunit
MPNYTNGKIYTIRFHNSNEIYIGSTTQSLAVRFGGHKVKNNSAVYKLIQDKYNGKWDECYYELYENYSCNNKEELCRKEGEIIRLFKDDEKYDCINCYVAGRNYKEYKKDNNDKIKEYKKEYYENNLEKLKEKQKQYYNNNIECIKEYQKEYKEQNIDKIKEYKKEYYENNLKKAKEQMKQYRENNVDKIKEKKKQYYEKNVDKLKEKINCDCGSCITKTQLLRHYKSKKHQEYLASLSAVIHA